MTSSSALRDRIATRRQAGRADLHLASTPTACGCGEQRGASIYTLSETGVRRRRRRSFAAKENKADILAGADLSQHDAVVATILIDLAQRDTNNKSIAFADMHGRASWRR